MKGSNIKSKMGRFTYSACALFFAGGLLVSCEDELLTGMPSWLGSSIYEELEKRGNYKTMLELINDKDVSTVDANGETEYARTLRLTGSKTLFVANDDAFTRFFQNNVWGAKSYSDLTPSQKKLLFNSSMINSAYLIELTSSTPGDNPAPGTVIRRSSSLNLYDTIPQLRASDMPNNEYWLYYRSKYSDAATGGMTVFRDNTTAPMVHFLSAYMSNKSITNDDLKFLTNGACDNTSESYINGQRLVERDITCQNGYIQVLENVMNPLTNMAEAIHNDGELSTFSKMLDRFAVPVYNEGLSNTVGVDSAFVWRYLNNGFDANVNGTNNALLTYKNVDYDAANVLSYDPGWNQYQNGSSNTPMSEDMAVIVAPTDAAFERYFQSGGGAALIDRYKYIDSIPNHIIVNMLDNFMKYSLVATVPSKFSSVMNTAQLEMGLSVGEPGGQTGIGSCLMANNGVVYKSNEVYNIPEYQSVAFPASLNDNDRNTKTDIMRYIINELDYQAYLNSMESMFLFILPTDEALKNYVDPVDYHKNQPTITEFYYDYSPSLTGSRIKCKRYNATKNADGTLTRGTEITNPWKNGSTESDYVTNRLKDILENSIIVQDKSATTSTGKSVWVTKGGCPVILEGTGANIRITTPYRKELADQNSSNSPYELKVREVEGYYNMGQNPDGNGETFIVDMEPVMSASKSVPTLLKELATKDNRYSEFSNMVENSTLVSQFYNITTSGSSSTGTAKTISNGLTLSVMENYNYTVYAPPTTEIEKMYENNLLPDWRDVIELEDKLDEIENSNPEEAARLEVQIDSMNTLINNFIRYHIQNSAVYQTAPASSGTYETSYMGGSRFATLTVSNSGQAGSGSIVITCNDANKMEIEGEAPRKVLDGNYFAREYRFRSGVSSSDGSASGPIACTDIESATRIFNSSTAVVHLIDKPLLYTKELSDAYNEISGN